MDNASENGEEMNISESEKLQTMPFTLSRTSDDVLQLLEHAKVDCSDIMPYTQTIQFSKSFGTEGDLKLIEVDNELLEFLKKGERFTIRGDGEEPAVLCTDSKTYEVREAETSNSLILIPNLEIPERNIHDFHSVSQKEVVGIQYKYFELKRCQPRLGKLYKLLEQVPYNDRFTTSFGCKWHDLLNQIQCSEEELREGLQMIKAYLIQDHWCLLDFDYHFSVLSLFLNYIDSNSLPLKEIKKEEIIEALKEIEPEGVLQQCFSHFFRQSEGNLYEINETDVSIFCAEVLLKPAGKFNLQDFRSIWQQSVPEGITTNLSQLKGVALVDEVSSPPVIWHFPVSSLPLDSSQAIAVLFASRQKWTLEDISPYLKEFVSPKTNIVALLSKYARASSINGVKYFTPKHSM